MRTAIGAAPRYAFFYGAIFLVIGIALPFWPLWLESRGLSAAQIGLLLGPAYWIKVVTTPGLAYVADRSGQTKMVLVVLAGIALLAYGGFFWASAYWQIFLLQLLAAATFFALNPLAESMTLAAVTRDNLDYGRIRLWGSITFILGALGTGALLEGRSSDIILWLIVGASCGALLAAIVFPAAPAPPSNRQAGQLRALLTQDAFIPFLIAAGLLQASHAVYYGFSSLNWQAAGLSKEVIGWLWAEGVIAEILLFAVAGKYLARFGPANSVALVRFGRGPALEPSGADQRHLAPRSPSDPACRHLRLGPSGRHALHRRTGDGRPPGHGPGPLCRHFRRPDHGSRHHGLRRPLPTLRRTGLFRHGWDQPAGRHFGGESRQGPQIHWPSRVKARRNSLPGGRKALDSSEKSYR